MAKMEQNPDGGRKEPSGHTKKQNNASARRLIQDVNFEEMNFEQRRAPYNSGSRNRSEEQYDENRNEERPDLKPYDR